MAPGNGFLPPMWEARMELLVSEAVWGSGSANRPSLWLSASSVNRHFFSGYSEYISHKPSVFWNVKNTLRGGVLLQWLSHCLKCTSGVT